ncbi:hypothetical protein G6F24_016640 [Rhizopus arrhizus]|nr:hypothetical protein G6F24_016640 [Rhizopus arrhizus]
MTSVVSRCWQMVEIDRLVVFQECINLRHIDQLAAATAASPDAREIMELVARSGRHAHPDVSGRGGDRPSLHRRLRAVRRGQPRPCHLSRFQRQPHQRNAHWPPDHSDQWLAPAVPAAQARLPLCPLPGDRCVRQRSVRRTVASSGQAGSAVLPGRFATADV